jgi:hypothetical protein
MPPATSPTIWERTKHSSKYGFDKVYGWVDKLGAPVNRASNKLGSEAFWPTTLDKESDKAARILRAFCKDGFYAEEDVRNEEGKPKGKQRVLKKIPAQVSPFDRTSCISLSVEEFHFDVLVSTNGLTILRVHRSFVMRRVWPSLQQCALVYGCPDLVEAVSL